MGLLGANKNDEPAKTAAPAATQAPRTPAAPAPAKASQKPQAKRGPKPGSKVQPLDLDLDGLEVVAVTDSQEMAKSRRTRGERSPEQKRLDAMVEGAWKAWKESGEPSEWPKMPGVKIRIAESKYETLVAGIRKAGNFYDLRVRFGRAVKSGGNVEVVFVVTDRPEKADDNGDN